MLLKKITIVGLSLIALSGCASNFFSLEDPWTSTDDGQFTEEQHHFERDKVVQAQNFSTPSRPFLRNSNWKVSHVDGQRINPTYNLTLHFRNNIYNKHDFLVTGNSGCNSYQGHLSLEIMQGKLVTDTQFRSTRHHCEDANLIAVEKEFINALFKNTNIEQNGTNSIVLNYRDKQFMLNRL